MLDGINDSVNFGKALFLAVLIWGIVLSRGLVYLFQ